MLREARGERRETSKKAPRSPWPERGATRGRDGTVAAVKNATRQSPCFWEIASLAQPGRAVADEGSLATPPKYGGAMT